MKLAMKNIRSVKITAKYRRKKSAGFFIYICRFFSRLLNYKKNTIKNKCSVYNGGI